jgi:hypothetical protein
VKRINKGSNKSLYIELDSRKGKKKKVQEDTNKRKGKNIVITVQKGGILISIANIVM